MLQINPVLFRNFRITSKVRFQILNIYFFASKRQIYLKLSKNKLWTLRNVDTKFHLKRMCLSCIAVPFFLTCEIFLKCDGSALFEIGTDKTYKLNLRRTVVNTGHNNTS